MHPDPRAKLREREFNRLRLLHRLYTLSNRNPQRRFSLHSLGAMVGVDEREMDLAAKFLSSVNLVRLLDQNTAICITDSGVTRIDAALLHPRGECWGFPSLLEAGLVTLDTLKDKREALEEVQCARLRLLYTLYALSDSDSEAWTPLSLIAVQLQTSTAEVRHLIEPMCGAQIDLEGESDEDAMIRLRFSGLLDVEIALREPHRASSRFPSAIRAGIVPAASDPDSLSASRG